jgi:hypothetical protein
MHHSNATPWLEAGYELFALEGLAALQVQPLVRHLNWSKTSIELIYLVLELQIIRYTYCFSVVGTTDGPAPAFAIPPIPFRVWQKAVALIWDWMYVQGSFLTSVALRAAG